MGRAIRDCHCDLHIPLHIVKRTLEIQEGLLYAHGEFEVVESSSSGMARPRTAAAHPFCPSSSSLHLKHRVAGNSAQA